MNRAHVLMALFYFSLFAGGAFGVYSTLYYHEIGLSITEIGLLGGIPPVVAALTQPTWGLAADRFGAKRVLLLALTLAAILYFSVPFARSFTAILVLLLFISVITNPVNPIADSTALSVLTNRSNYGNLRLFGSLGYALAALVGGAVLPVGNYAPLYDVMAAAYLLNAFVSLGLPARLDRGSRVSLQDAWALVRSGRVPYFLLCTSLTIMAVTGNWVFFPLWFTSHGASTRLVGIAFFIEAFLEVPWFFLISRFRDRLSDAALLSIGIAAYIIRFALLALNIPIYVVLLTQFLPGLGFTSLYAAQVHFMDRHTPDSLKATGQTILSVAGMGGIGTLLGGVIMGFVAQNMSLSGAYGVACGLLVVQFPLVALIRDRQIKGTLAAVEGTLEG